MQPRVSLPGPPRSSYSYSVPLSALSAFRPSFPGSHPHRALLSFPAATSSQVLAHHNAFLCTPSHSFTPPPMHSPLFFLRFTIPSLPFHLPSFYLAPLPSMPRSSGGLFQGSFPGRGPRGAWEVMGVAHGSRMGCPGDGFQGCQQGQRSRGFCSRFQQGRYRDTRSEGGHDYGLLVSGHRLAIIPPLTDHGSIIIG